jgi:glycine cleavage system protein P-like pyridoxal-binding family
LILEKYFPKLKDHLLVCVTETKTKDDMDAFVNEMKGIVGA